MEKWSKGTEWKRGVWSGTEGKEKDEEDDIPSMVA